MFKECFVENTNNVINVINVIDVIKVATVAKKRGRKSKKEINETLKNKENIIVKMEDPVILTNENPGNPVILTNENPVILTNENPVILNNENPVILTNENIVVFANEDETDTVIDYNTKPIGKKRGRKPKGGKIIQQIIPLNNQKELKQNVVLHLKCSLKDLNCSTSLFGSNLEGYSFSQTNNLCYDGAIFNEQHINSSEILNNLENLTDGNYNNTNNVDNKEVCNKLKLLEHNLHTNNTDNKKSACFWDTCEFDNSPISIPKYFMNNSYHVYGCFCSPECAVAYLMEEKLDSSVKFERYQLINHIYSKVYNYNKNIKPAPNPYYMLEKYYGNLNIQEYRALLRYERLYLIVDKPLTRIMPELHADNDDFIISNKIIPTNNTQFKNIKKTTKTNILSEQFGLLC